MTNFLHSQKVETFSPANSTCEYSTQSSGGMHFSLASLSPESRRLVNLVVSTPGALAKFVEKPEAAWQEFGGEVDAVERRKLEILAEIFLPNKAIVVAPIYNDGNGVWVTVFG